MLRLSDCSFRLLLIFWAILRRVIFALAVVFFVPILLLLLLFWLITKRMESYCQSQNGTYCSGIW